MQQSMHARASAAFCVRRACAAVHRSAAAAAVLALVSRLAAQQDHRAHWQSAPLAHTTKRPNPSCRRRRPVLPSPHYGLIGHNLAVPAVGSSAPLPYTPFLRHTHLPPRPPAPSSLASRPTHAYPTARRASSDGTLTGCPAGRALRAHCCAACSRRALPAARASLSSGLRTARSSARRQSCWTCASRRARTRSTSRWRMTGLADRGTARHGRAGEGTRGGDV